MSETDAIVTGVWWARCVKNGAAIWLETYADEAGVLDMAAAKRACDAGRLACPDCGGALSATSASPGLRRAHFKHRKNGEASCSGRAWMSAEHRAAQDNLMEALQRRHPHATVRLEVVSRGADGRSGRSDIALQLPDGARLCIEVQHSHLGVADLQQRTRDRARDGYVLEWVFIRRDAWADSLKPPAMLEEVLRSRGYVYLLEDPMAVEPKFRIAIAPQVAFAVRDLRKVRLPKGHVHVLRVTRPVRAFIFTGGVPGAAGLRCERLHQALAGWMTSSQLAIARRGPRSVPREKPKTRLWEADRQRLERELARAVNERRVAQAELDQANVAATATQAAAEQARMDVLEVSRLRRSKRRHLMSVAAQAGRRAIDANDRLGPLREAVAQRDKRHRAASEILAEHLAGETVAKQADEDRHAQVLQTAHTKLQVQLRPAHALIERWVQALPVES